MLRSLVGSEMCIRDRCGDEIQKTGSEYAPSFTKLLGIVSQLPCSSTTLQQIATEYALLHLGSRRWRAKQWRAGGSDSDETSADSPHSDPEPEPEPRPDPEPEPAGAETEGPEGGELAVVLTSEERIPNPHSHPKPHPKPSEEGTAAGKLVLCPEGNDQVVVLGSKRKGSQQVRVVKEAKRQEAVVHGSRMNVDASPSMVPPSMVESAVPWERELDCHDLTAVGRWGEALVYQLVLQQAGAGRQVSWVNRDGETRAAYDITVSDLKGTLHSTCFIEVKSTRFEDKNVFPLSLCEWDFASKPGVDYRVYRVYCAGSKDRVRVAVVDDLHRAVREGKAQLCLAV
eukprot:TRINITY_DN11225_c0_g1_i1.p1 TRINITY_DN11225_c0_g1~~TRINITY_DN11225_c0_g1_i1.p1  ORF type:complete len:342 (+),score=74.52 TRINITY_DN11225_c0_g1_i1:137-1162(+)